MNIELKDMSNYTPIPEGKMPLFGDCFDALPLEEREKCCKVYTIDGRDHLLTRAAQHMADIDFLDLSESDAVYGSMFNMMIKEAFRDNKNFIVARVKSRGQDKYDNENPTSLYPN